MLRGGKGVKPGAGRGNVGNTQGNRNRQRPPPPPDAGNNKGAFGGGLGNIALGAGLGFAGSQMFGGSDTAIGSALNNVSEGVGDAIGGIGEGVGDVASGVGSATGSLGAGAGTAVGAVGSGVGSGVGSVGAGLGNMAQYIPLALAGVGIFLVYNMTSQRMR